MRYPVVTFGAVDVYLAQSDRDIIITSVASADFINSVQLIPDIDLYLVAYEYQIYAGVGGFCFHSGNMTFPGMTTRPYLDVRTPASTSTHKRISQGYLIPAGTVWNWSFNISTGQGISHQYLRIPLDNEVIQVKKCDLVSWLTGRCTA